jgi:hypothetical protein
MIQELEAKPGDKIWPKWLALIDWINRQRHQSPNAKISYTTSGARVVCTPEEFFQNIFFEVRLVGEKITVGEGTINGKVPEVKGVPITGSINPPEDPPEISLIEPEKDGIVLICIKTTHKSNGDLDTATIEAKLQKDLPGALRADFASGVNGFIPIALIRHDPQTKKPVSVHQHSVHNLQCRAYNSGAGTRIVYWAA